MEKHDPGANAFQRAIIVFSVVCVFVLISPLLYLTQRVYRAPLPYQRIETWKTAPPTYFDITIMMHLDPEISSRIVEEIHRDVASIYRTSSGGGLRFNFERAVDQKSQNGNYRIKTECQNSNNEIIVQTDRSVVIKMKNCKEAQHIITAAISGLFADEHEQMIRYGYSKTEAVCDL